MFVEHRATEFGMAKQEDSRRRRRDRLGHDQRPPGLRLRQGFHGVRRLAVGSACGKDPEGAGHGAEERRADHRPLRRRRRAHPGGRRLARRLCRGVPAQRAFLRRHPADLRHHGAVRRRRRLFARHDRLHLHGAQHQLHVRHRAGCGEDRHQRDGDAGRARRRLRAYGEILHRRRRLRQRRRHAAGGPPAVRLPAAVEPRGPAADRDRRSVGPRASPRSTR